MKTLAQGIKIGIPAYARKKGRAGTPEFMARTSLVAPVT